MFIKSRLRKTVFGSTIDPLFSYLCFVVLDWFDDSLSKRTNYSPTSNFGAHIIQKEFSYFGRSM
jgi:hypothetical protein